jgi:hypothetical protein
MVNTLGRRIRYLAPLIALGASSVALEARQQSRECTAVGSLVPLAGLHEASGLAMSRRTPARLWTHNDSGQPVLFALDSKGAVAGQVRVTGAQVEDWEAIAAGACDAGSCLYIGDIGDNEARRSRITVYQLSEPAEASGTAPVSAVFHATYPDGAHDAETLLAANGRLYVITKGETGPVALYRFPVPLHANTTMKLERVGEIASKVDADSRITDGSVSPDGQWVVLRSRSALSFLRAAGLLSGQARAASTFRVTSLAEPQGEGVALGADNSVFLTGEGGGQSRSGTFARLSCALPRG